MCVPRGLTSNVMADECDDDDGEWLDYSSPCINLQHNSLDAVHEKQQDESQAEDLQCDLSEVEKLEKIREVLKSSLCETSTLITAPCAAEVPMVSQIKGPCNHWLWAKLVSKLNSLRQPKWDGSCLEDCYHRCLQISMNTNPEESPAIYLDHYAKNVFSFHDMNTFSSRLDNDNLSSGNSEKELVNKNELDCTEKLDFNGKLKNKSDRTFEDIDPELEWSDNDVKDESAVTSSFTSSGFDESEASADLARLSYEEIVHLRNELNDYTKQYSDILVVELKNRDGYIREKELKNDFISSFLAVQAKTREATLAATKKKFSLQSNSSSTSQSVTTIPYEIQNEGPSSEILEKLIEIMEAMRADSSDVPTLLTNYILKVLCK